MELIILTSISIILIVFLVLSFINEHLGFEKFNLKSKITTNIFSLIISPTYFIFFLLGLLFLVLPFFTTMMFALRGIPHG